MRTDWTVARAIVEMRRQAQVVDHVYTVYVVDKDDRLYGILPLKDLLFSAESTRTLIKHICETDVVSVQVETDVEEVVHADEEVRRGGAAGGGPRWDTSWAASPSMT